MESDSLVAIPAVIRDVKNLARALFARAPAVKVVNHKYTLHRKFEGAVNNRLTADQPISAAHINSDLSTSGVTLIARSRWMAQNDSYIRRGIKLITNNVVGSGGIMLDPMIKNSDGTLDTELNKSLTKAYSRWGKRKSVNPYGSWRQLQRNSIGNKIRDGESFIHTRIGAPTKKNPFGFWVDFIDPLRIPFNLTTVSPTNQNQIIMGIEFSQEDNSPVAYHVRVSHRNPRTDWTFQGNHLMRVLAENVIHEFDPEFPGQVRGFSSMVGAMRTAPMLDGYIEAALISARQGASTMGFYIQSEKAADDYEGDEDDEEDEDGEFIEEVEPGIMRKLPKGWEPKFHNPNFPNTSHSEFVKSILRGMASDFGVSYSTFANDLENVNLSSIRHGTQEDREQYKQHQQDQIETVHEQIYALWLTTALGTQQIAPGRRPLSLNDETVRRLSDISFRARGWEFAEPLKEANANLIEIQTATKTPQGIVESRGGDWIETIDELQKNYQQLKDRGISSTIENISIVIGATAEETDNATD